MKKIFYLLILFTSYLKTSAQSTDTLNKFNENHEKQGFWKAFLSEDFKVIQDSSQAFYFGYEAYDRGVSLYPLVQFRKKVKTELRSEKGKAIPLNGKLIVYDKHGRAVTEENYSNGFPTQWYGYWWDKSGKCKLKEVLDYTNRYKNQPGSFSFEKYDANNVLIEKYYYGRNEKGRWDFIK